MLLLLLLLFGQMILILFDHFDLKLHVKITNGDFDALNAVLTVTGNCLALDEQYLPSVNTCTCSFGSPCTTWVTWPTHRLWLSSLAIHQDCSRVAQQLPVLSSPMEWWFPIIPLVLIMKSFLLWELPCK